MHNIFLVRHPLCTAHSQSTVKPSLNLDIPQLWKPNPVPQSLHIAQLQWLIFLSCWLKPITVKFLSLSCLLLLSLCLNNEESYALMTHLIITLALTPIFQLIIFSFVYLKIHYFTFVDPINTINYYSASFHYLDTHHIIEALQPFQMVMACSCNLDKAFDNDHIKFLSQDSQFNPIGLLESSTSQECHGFQEDFFGYHDQIYDWLKASYLASSISNNKFRSFLMFAKN